MKYPHVITEARTLALLHDGHSIARFGDGELRLAIGKECTSQRRVPGLAEELRAMLQAPRNCLIGIPNFAQTPKAENWTRYAGEQFTRLYGAKEYASSFITRPDSAPWIDTPEYWAEVRRLWAGRDVILVRGDEKSITPAMLDGSAASVRIVDGPRQHAYADIDAIEKAILKAAGDVAQQLHSAPLVILCLGATATALAYRLAQKPGLQAVDLGHIGMFMRHAGAYRYLAGDLVSADYREQLEILHSSARKWGTDGAKHAEKVLQLVDELGAKTILDYGCGKGRLAEAIAPVRVQGYDPGIPERAGMPKPCDLVVCTDVLEHVEPDRLPAVLDHIGRLAGKAAYLVISTREALAMLPDGRNAHLIVRPGCWWVNVCRAMGEVEAEIDGKEVRLCIRK
jgi:hypothetical protein